ncbi:hypothetical protein ACVWY2_009894 [Bradyrhizobium sp. JR6.1]
MSTPLMIVLVLLLCAGANTLWLDARQRRMDRQLEIALPTAEAATLVSIRRAAKTSRWHMLHRLSNYRPDAVYMLRPIYVLLAGGMAGAAIIYVNAFLKFPGLYAGIAAAGVAILVVRGLFGWQQHRFDKSTVPATSRRGSAGDEYGPVRVARPRSISHHRPRDAATDIRAVCHRLQRTEYGPVARGGCGRRLPADAGAGICDVCGDPGGAIEDRRQPGGNAANAG